MIWKQPFNIEILNKLSENGMVAHLGIEFTEFGPDFIEAKMPVDHRTMQPDGLLHGGASVVLAETLGSVAATLCLEDFQNTSIVGLEINANHLSSARDGFVIGRTTPIKIGRRIQVWNIEIRDEADKKICISRLTTAVIEVKK